MALSTRAKIAGLGGALALGVLGATGYAYAADGAGASASYVTTVDEGSTSTAPSAAPSEQAPRSGDRGDCPEKSGGSGGSSSGGSSGTGTAPAPNPADA